jgi:hypothetical protein
VGETFFLGLPSRYGLALPILVVVTRRSGMSAEEVPNSGENEVDMVLNALRELQEKVVSPVIRACLESAREDIAHLAGSSGTDIDEAAEKPC